MAYSKEEVAYLTGRTLRAIDDHMRHIRTVDHNYALGNNGEFNMSNEELGSYFVYDTYLKRHRRSEKALNMMLNKTDTLDDSFKTIEKALDKIKKSKR